MEKEITPLHSINQEIPLAAFIPSEGNKGSSTSPLMIYDESSDDIVEKHCQLIYRELQRLIEQYKDATHMLHRTTSYVDYLREENLLLVSEHLELLSLVEEKKKSVPASFPEIPPSPLLMFAELRGKLGHPNLGSEKGKETATGNEGDAADGKQNFACNNLPKSISIRSSGFLAARHLSPRDGDLSSTHARQSQRVRLQAPRTLQDYGGEGVVDVDAYSQGTAKTELCNKWGAMGCCPYAERCQFAHGLEELRPVIRHPRYKTQICRMLSSGNGCPYGHRCHFRHSALP